MSLLEQPVRIRRILYLSALCNLLTSTWSWVSPLLSRGSENAKAKVIMKKTKVFMFLKYIHNGMSRLYMAA